MIVESEGVVALDIEIILLTAGYQITATAHTAQQAIQIAQQGIPDLALIDVGLQGPMDGIELAQLLQQRLNLAIVFLTGHTDQQMLGRAGVAHPLGFVPKPFDQAELLSSIEVASKRVEM